MKNSDFVVYIDGASRGNPGRAAVGVWIGDSEGKEVKGLSRYLGTKTNNQAEYMALLLGLREVSRLGGDSVRVFTDSELLARQIQGVYRVKDMRLKALHEKALRMIHRFSSFRIESIPREANEKADRLADQAIRRRILQERKKGGPGGEGMVAPRRPPAKGG